MKPLRAPSLLLVGALLLLLPRTAAAQNGPDGKALYDRLCKSCHGPAGAQPTPAMVKLMKVQAVTDSAFITKFSEDSLVTILEKGTGSKYMKPYAEKMTREEMVALVKYLKTFERKSGP
ncbi:MAG: cytochrome c [Betaproteobacteria bacterium]|nr:cytochrome c [Betaproteobacteria bacterium]